MGSSRLTRAAITVFAIAVTARMAPFFWTSYPFNPDAFNFAAQADATLASGTFAHGLIGPHGYVFPTLLTQLGAITGVDPLWLAQPTIAIIGSIPALLVVLFVWRFGRSLARPDLRATAATAAGLALATEGVYLRRTVTVSYEVLGLLFVLLVAIAAHRILRTRRPGWAVAIAPLLLALPVTHHLSSFITALVVTAVVVLGVLAVGLRAVLPGALLVSFWLYVGVYYWLTRPPFSAELAAKPGLFVAWVLVLCVFAYWLTRASDRAIRLTAGGVPASGFAIIGANLIWDLFPGTGTTPRLLAVFVAPLLVFAVLAVWGFPRTIGLTGEDRILIALFAAPTAWVGFAFSAGIDPVYVLFARRGQTFLHFSVAVFAGVAILDLFRSDSILARTSHSLHRHARWVLPTLLVTCTLVSLPMAFADLHVFAYQGTTTGEEFQTATFVAESVTESWTGDDHITRIARNYYGAETTTQPVRQWLRTSSRPPPQPLVTQESWQTVGAQVYPQSPLTVDPDTYQCLTDRRQVVYTTTGTDPLHVLLPTETSAECP